MLLLTFPRQSGWPRLGVRRASAASRKWRASVNGRKRDSRVRFRTEPPDRGVSALRDPPVDSPAGYCPAPAPALRRASQASRHGARVHEPRSERAARGRAAGSGRCLRGHRRQQDVQSDQRLGRPDVDADGHPDQQQSGRGNGDDVHRQAARHRRHRHARKCIQHLRRRRHRGVRRGQLFVLRRNDSGSGRPHRRSMHGAGRRRFSGFRRVHQHHSGERGHLVARRQLAGGVGHADRCSAATGDRRQGIHARQSCTAARRCPRRRHASP